MNTMVGVHGLKFTYMQWFTCLFAVFLLGCSSSHTAEELPDQVDFNYHIRPILSNSCYVCHGPDISTREADLRLDTYAGATAQRSGGPAIIPGSARRSLLIQRITAEDPKNQMPPPEMNKVLTEYEIALLSKWIDQGAEYKTHWALIAPQRHPNKTSIDEFLNERLSNAGIVPAETASRDNLIRRASYILTGLPPSPQDVEAFERDHSTDAYENVIDSLLNSPAYGERWARHWMDLMRYSESRGHEFDYTIQGAWHYRDYLIRAFNEDVPYDQLILEHLAGDVLESPRIHPEDGFNESVIGTAYFALGEGKHSPVDTRIDEADRIDNIIDVTTKTFQGFTVACSRCHDHKFDPIPTTDYYSLYGIIESARFTPTPILSENDLHRIQALAMFNQQFRQEVATSWQSSLDPVPAVATSHQEESSDAIHQDTSQTWEVLGDFRDGTLDGWMAHGPAFMGDVPQNGFPIVQDNRLVQLSENVISSRTIAKGLPGGLRSPTFTLSQDSITVFARGYQSALRLVIDNFQLIQAPIHGELDQELHTDVLTPYSFGVSMWKGSKAYIELLVGTYDKGRYVTERHTLALHDSSYFEIAYAIAHDDIRPPLQLGSSVEADVQASVQAWAEHKATPKHISSINRALAAGTLQRPVIPTMLRQQRAILEQMSPIEFFVGMREGDRVTSSVFGRGNYQTPVGDPVPHRFLTALDTTGTYFTKTSSGRLEFAEAMLDPANPLTARVMVNRLWHHVFGRGIVETVDNFGAQGSLPSHPELLDYLALRFVESRWSVKSILREMVLSDAFQRSTLASDGVSEEDPTNMLLSHYPVRRLEAESIRDGLLAVSGRLNPTMFGPPVPIHLTEFMEGRGKPEINGPLDGDGRRSIYIALRRNFLSPMMLAFDMPIPFSAFGARNVSNVPAQSLTMLNDEFVAEQSRVWGISLMTQPHPDMKSRIEHVYRKAFSRLPDSEELAEAESFLIAEAEYLRIPREDIMVTPEVWIEYCHVIFNQKEFIFLI